MKNLLSKLTIVIPTCNRQRYALRNMRYWSGQGATVLIMDGSVAPIQTYELDEIDCNVHYKHNDCSFEERLEIALTQITTEYAMLCGDDEFQIFSGLIECIKFLEANADYTSCCGRCIGFSVQTDKNELFPVKDYHKTHFVNQNSIGDRIRYHISNFMTTTIYGVHRRDSFKFCLTGISKDFSSPYVSETIFELLSSAYGKSKILSNASWVRSFENKPIQTSTYDREYYISKWYDDPLKVEEVDRFYVHLKKMIYSLCPSNEIKSAWLSTCYALKIRINNDRDGLLGVQSEPILTSKVRMYQLKIKSRSLKNLVKLSLQKLKPLNAKNYYINSSHYSYENLKDQFNIDVDDKEINFIMEIIRHFHMNPS